MYVQYGLGDAAQDVGIASSLGTPLAVHAAAPAVASTLGISAGLAVPLIGAALAGVTLAITALIRNSGCGPTCIQASEYANKAEPLLKQNLQAYLALPAPRSQSAQQAALQNFDAIWQQFEQLCQSGSLAGTTAGKNCIGDRAQGACHYKTSPGGWAGTQYTYPGSNGSGSACWNWDVGYRLPISSDPNVVSDSQAVLAGGGDAAVSVGGASVPLWGLIAAAALAAWVLL